MSALEQALPITKRPQKRLNSAEKQAAIAAVATGTPQTEVAKQFGVHPNTIRNLLVSVRKLNHPANVLNKDWKSAVRDKAQRAIDAGLEHRDDPYKAATIGVKVLEGIGDFHNTLQVDGNMSVTFSWQTPQEVEHDVIECESTPVSALPVSD